MKRALAIDGHSFGPDHPNVAIHLNNLAALLQDTNRLSEAEPLYRRALAIDEQSFGPDHPNATIHLNNLAALLQDTNRLSEAEPLMRRAMAIAEKSFGLEHPKCAIISENLRLLLQKLEKAQAKSNFNGNSNDLRYSSYTGGSSNFVQRLRRWLWD